MTKKTEVVQGEVESGTPSALAVVRDDMPDYETASAPNLPVVLAPGGQLAALTMTPEQVALIMAPIEDDEIEFRWGDKAQTYALAYASHAVVRLRLCKAFPGRWVLVEHGINRVGSHVIFHGSLYIDRQLIASCYGGLEYRDDNDNMTWDDAIEGARSNCLRRCVKDLGMFLELYDKKFTGPREAKWVDDNTLHCPKKFSDGTVCGRKMRKSQTEWYCWRKNGGCGHTVPLEDSGAAAGSPPAPPKTAEAQASTPPPTPKREPPTWDHGSHTSTVAKEKPASAESITAAGAKVRQTDTSVVIAKIRATMANSLFSDADRKLAEDRIHKNAPDEQGAQYLPWAEKNLAIVQAALVSRQKNAKKDTEAQRLDDIKTKAQDVIMDKCWTDLERAALTERLPKETGTVTTATKFLDEIHNRLVSKTPPCNCDLPWDEKGNPQ